MQANIQPTKRHDKWTMGMTLIRISEASEFGTLKI